MVLNNALTPKAYGRRRRRGEKELSNVAGECRLLKAKGRAEKKISLRWPTRRMKEESLVYNGRDGRVMSVRKNETRARYKKMHYRG